MTKITFGIIALNAQPFLEYNLRALYPFAHEIIVVEGAVRAAASIARADGHSLDGTLEMLEQFRKNSDPEKKICLVTARADGNEDGFWPEKDEMSQAYAKRATGDWLWQVDGDEFYLDEDISAIASILETEPEIDTVSLPYIEFFGGFKSYITGVWQQKEFPLVHRIFKWRPGYTYKSHRPSTVVDEKGISLREKRWIVAPSNGGRPIRMLHYSYVFPKQAQQKVGYYSNVDWTDAFRQNQRWLEESYIGLRSPMFLGEKGWPHLQWLERYKGPHPNQILQLQQDLADGKIKEPTRRADDINALLESPVYALKRAIAKALLFIFWPLRSAWKQLRSRLVSMPRS